jgi:COMPASS component SPP1
MPFKLSELLNPISEPSSPKPSAPSHSNVDSRESGGVARDYTSASYSSNQGSLPQYEAAASPANLSAPPTQSTYAYSYSHAQSQSHSLPHSQSPQMSSRDSFPPIATNTYSYSDSRRRSSVAPVEPSPVLDRSPTATLDQYHQKPSRSPDELRRQSFSHFEAPTVLAPIHSTTSASALVYDEQAPPPGTAFNSRIISPPITSTPNNAAVVADNHMEQNQEPENTRDTPVTTQIREPSPPKMSGPAPEAVMSQPPVQSPPHIKDEPSNTPRERIQTPTASDLPNSVAGQDLDPETLKIIEEAKNQFGLRGQKGRHPTDELPSPLAEPASTPAEPSKKRPAPKTTAANKKGTAKKPPPKKRKVETDTGHTKALSSTARDTTPSSRTPKATPFNASKGPGTKSKSNTPALGSSPAPGTTDVPSSEVEDDAASDASNEEYCICRKGDNHTWMIACDGGCEDWFHGKCVDMREEDGNLIDKYICPNCVENGVGFTTWLPMCRKTGCRQPARVKGVPSKYCSDECGREFMQMNVAKSSGATGSPSGTSKAKSRRKANQTDNHGDSTGFDGTADSDEDMGPRGGALRPGEIKALITSVPDITLFRQLGDGVPSPPATASPSTSKFPDSAKLTNGDTTNGENSRTTNYTLSSVESLRITAIDEEKNLLRMKRALLKDKEKFVGMTREQVGKYAEREGIKPKDVCGYDRRLTWTEEQFDRWRQSKEGATALEMNSLDQTENGGIDGVTGPKESESDKMDVDGEPISDAPKEKDHFCTRKRCERHRQWQKQALSDVRFEESTLADQMRRLDKEDREIREGAMLRWRKEMGGQGGEGWVEVVESS